MSKGQEEVRQKLLDRVDEWFLSRYSVPATPQDQHEADIASLANLLCDVIKALYPACYEPSDE